jgi:hypothetical protein
MREAAHSEEILKGRASAWIPLTSGQHMSPEPLKAVFNGFSSDVLGHRVPLQLLPLADPDPGLATAEINGARADGLLKVGEGSLDEAMRQLIPRVPDVPGTYDHVEQITRRQVGDVTRPQRRRRIGYRDGARNYAHTPYLSGRSPFLTRPTHQCSSQGPQSRGPRLRIDPPPRICQLTSAV